MPERYAVVSCHVERILDDGIWEAFSRLQASRPGGFRIAPLVRPPDPDPTAGEAGEERAATWVARTRAAAQHGPLGLHTHFGGREHGRPRPGGLDPAPADRVRAELAAFAAHGLEPRFFCGGNWHLDAAVAEVLAGAGLADCTGRPVRPGHLDEGVAWLQAAAPVRLRLDPTGTTTGGSAAGSPPSGLHLLELPTTHSLGEAARAALAPGAPAALHVYFHDYDLLDPARARALRLALALLGRRRPRLDLDELAAACRGSAPVRDLALS